MSSLSEITEKDKIFLRRVVNRAEEEGYIRETNGTRHTIRSSGSECCLIGVCAADRDSSIVILIIAFVASFFVGMYYTGNSVRNVVEANNEVKEADLALNAYRFQGVGPIFSNVKDVPNLDNVEYLQQGFPKGSLSREDAYDQALIIANGRRNERITAAGGQALMTIGAGLLTVALIIVLLVEPEFIDIGLLSTFVAGGGLVITGASIWFMKLCWCQTARAEDAATKLRELWKEEALTWNV